VCSKRRCGCSALEVCLLYTGLRDPEDSAVAGILDEVAAQEGLAVLGILADVDQVVGRVRADDMVGVLSLVALGVVGAGGRRGGGGAAGAPPPAPAGAPPATEAAAPPGAGAAPKPNGRNKEVLQEERTRSEEAARAAAELRSSFCVEVMAGSGPGLGLGAPKLYGSPRGGAIINCCFFRRSSGRPG